MIDETAVENWIDRMGSSCGGTIVTEWICGWITDQSGWRELVRVVMV